MWILVDQTNGALHQLNENGLTFIGRESSNEVTVKSTSVEKWRHAVIANDVPGGAVTTARFRLKDLGSSSGTFVNGTKLEVNNASSDDWVVLNDGDSIRFGSEDAATFKLVCRPTSSSTSNEPQCRGGLAETSSNGAFYLPVTNSSSPQLYLATPTNAATLFSAASPATTTFTAAPVFAAYPVTVSSANAGGSHNQNVTAVAFTPAFIASSRINPTSPQVAHSSAQTSPTRSLSNSTAGPGNVLDNLEQAVHAVSNNDANFHPPSSASSIVRPIAAVTATRPEASVLPIALDNGFGDSPDAITQQRQQQPQPTPNRPQCNASPPVRDRVSSPLIGRDESQPQHPSKQVTPPPPPAPPTAFAVDFSCNDGDHSNERKITEGDDSQQQMSINDSISKFLPERLRQKQLQQEEEKARSREAIARDLQLKQQQQQQQRTASKKGSTVAASIPKNSGAASIASGSVKSAPKAPASPLVTSPTVATSPGVSNGPKAPEMYSEHTLYKEAIDFDRRIAKESASQQQGVPARPTQPQSAPSQVQASYGLSEQVSVPATPDDNGDNASECGTYTIAVDDGTMPATNAANGAGQNGEEEPHYPWQSVLDKFFASAPNQGGKYEDDDATPSGSPSNSGSATDVQRPSVPTNGNDEEMSKIEAEIDRLAQERAINVSLQDVKATTTAPGRYQGATSNASSNGQPKKQAPIPQPQPSPVVIAQPRQRAVPPVPQPQPQQSQAARAAAMAAQFVMPPPPVPSRNPALINSRRPNSATASQSQYSPSTSGVKSSTVQASITNSLLVNDSLSTELLLQDTEKVVKSLQQRQQQKLLAQAQGKGQLTPRLSPRNAPERRSMQPSSAQARRPVSSTASGRASSTSRNTSIGSGLDVGGDSASDIYATGRDRVYVRLTAATASSAAKAAAARRDNNTSTMSTPTASVVDNSPRGRSRQSLGAKIVLKSRDNARLDQFRGAAAIASVQQGVTKTSRNRLQAKLTPAEEQKARELEAWRRRKGYDPRKSVADERAQKRSSRASSLSRNSVESNDEGDYRMSLLTNNTSVQQSRDQDQPRELTLDDFASMNAPDDEFILVYDDGEDELSNGAANGHFEQQPDQQSNNGLLNNNNLNYRNRDYRSDGVVVQSADYTASVTPTTALFDSSSSTSAGNETPRPTKQYQQLKDGRRVMVLTDEAWCKPDCPVTSPPQAPPSSSVSVPMPSSSGSNSNRSNNQAARDQNSCDNSSSAKLNGVTSKKPIIAPSSQQQQSPMHLPIVGSSATGTTNAMPSNRASASSSYAATATVAGTPVMSMSTFAAPVPPNAVVSDQVMSSMIAPRTTPQNNNSVANAASLERVDSLILSSVYRLAAKLTDRAASVVGKPAPVRQHNPALMLTGNGAAANSSGGTSKAISTESQLVGTLTELHRLERLIDEIADMMSASSISSTSQSGTAAVVASTPGHTAATMAAQPSHHHNQRSQAAGDAKLRPMQHLGYRSTTTDNGSGPGTANSHRQGAEGVF